MIKCEMIKMSRLIFRTDSAAIIEILRCSAPHYHKTNSSIKTRIKNKLQGVWIFFLTLFLDCGSCLSWFHLGVSVCTLNTSAAAELAEFRKITTFEGKNTTFNEHPVYTRSLTQTDITRQVDGPCCRCDGPGRS